MDISVIASSYEPGMKWQSSHKWKKNLFLGGKLLRAGPIRNRGDNPFLDFLSLLPNHLMVSFHWSKKNIGTGLQLILYLPSTHSHITNHWDTINVTIRVKPAAETACYLQFEPMY